MKITKQGYEFEVDQYTRENLPQLLERVRLGNDKLNKAWNEICAIKDNEAHNKAVEEWHKANVLLSYYCDQLEWLGYQDCLYIQDGADIASKDKEEVQRIMEKIDQGIYKKVGDKIKTRSCLGIALGCRVCPSKKPYWEDEFMSLGRGNNE